jgi:hypothetical protein
MSAVVSKASPGVDLSAPFTRSLAEVPQLCLVSSERCYKSAVESKTSSGALDLSAPFTRSLAEVPSCVYCSKW